MSYLYHGKHVHINRYAPCSVGICDKTQQIFLHKDLCRQMEWRGNTLEWTGLLVGRPHLDKPNPQLRPNILPPDPVPIQMPRFDQMVNSIPPPPNATYPYTVAVANLTATNFSQPPVFTYNANGTPTGNPPVPPAANAPIPAMSQPDPVGYDLLNQTFFG
jgi:hypothetical protein